MDTRTLPATGRTVPATPALTLGPMRQMRTSDGVAFGLPVKVGKAVIGEIENEGRGGGTWFRPGSGVGRLLWEEYVAACRSLVPERYGPRTSATGGTYDLSEELIADDLVDEVELLALLTRTAKRAAFIIRKSEGWGEDPPDDDLTRDPFAFASSPRGTLTDDVRSGLLADGFTHHWTGGAWASLTTEESTMPAAAAPTDEKLAKKREEERQRAARIKAANKRLAGLPKDEQTRVKGAAARAEKDARAAGKRTAAVVFLEQALDKHGAPGSAASTPKATERPKTPKERSTPKETPGQLAPEKKTAKPKAAKVPAPRAEKRSGPTAVQAKVEVTVPATHKLCTRCHENKPLADFLNKAGTGKPRPTCRPCYNEAWREFDKARKARKAAEAAAADTQAATG